MPPPTVVLPRMRGLVSPAEGGGEDEIGRGAREVCADLITGRGLSKCTCFRRLLLSMQGDLRRAVDDRVTGGLFLVSVGENHEFTTASIVGVEFGLLILALFSSSRLSRLSCRWSERRVFEAYERYEIAICDHTRSEMNSHNRENASRTQ